jgi:hypothetical protein
MPFQSPDNSVSPSVLRQYETDPVPGPTIDLTSQPHPTMLLMARVSELVGRSISHYRILRKIGSVGMVVVCEVEDL